MVLEMSDFVEAVKLDELFRKIPENCGLDPRLIEDAKTELNVLKYKAGINVQYHKQKSWSKTDAQQLRDQLQEKETEILLLKKQLQNRDSLSRGGGTTESTRVIKIRDNFKHLFEQEWSEAYDYFKLEGWNEIEIIVTLQRILRASYSFSKDVAHEQLQNIEGEALYPSATWMDDDGIITRLKQRQITREIVSLAKLYQKTTAQECLPSLQKTFIDHVLPTFIDPSRYSNRITQKYTKQCIDITWSMCVQDPPMVFLDKLDRGAEFDTEKFRKYSTTGSDKFDYLVWPAMLLHQGGPLVAKGIAQPIKTTPEVESEVMSTGSKTPLLQSKQQPSRRSQNPEDVIYIEPDIQRVSPQTPPKLYKRPQSGDENIVPGSPFFAPFSSRTPAPPPQGTTPIPALHVTNGDKFSWQGRSATGYQPDNGNLTVAWKHRKEDRLPSAP